MADNDSTSNMSWNYLRCCPSDNESSEKELIGVMIFAKEVPRKPVGSGLQLSGGIMLWIRHGSIKANTIKGHKLIWP
ncbi:hypothetical protein CDAR_454611 [Caerostris darwini]|uniref:Uncharacterized protein n=1 Tax=Caerostris darwini TaxID=1538125 RepID=A0AAV4TXU1_9ARAC|nr:hypothetical protein CDAR_454611 [Caerostris darwini]